MEALHQLLKINLMDSEPKNRQMRSEVVRLEEVFIYNKEFAQFLAIRRSSNEVASRRIRLQR